MLDRTSETSYIEGMNKLTTSKRAEVIRCLVEGNSIRSTVRITGAAKNTVTKLLVDAGRACSVYQNENLRNLPCRRIQVDEVRIADAVRGQSLDRPPQVIEPGADLAARPDQPGHDLARG